MGNELVPQSRGGFLATNDDYFAALANEAEGLKGGGGKAFMKFDGNNGNYSYGADDIELPLSAQLVINPMSYERGWVIWSGGDVVYENMTPLMDGDPITKAQLPDKGPYGKDDGPVEQYVIDFKTLEEPLVEMVFQANNVSKRRALGALLKDWGRTYKNHPQCLPIIEIGSVTFEAKGENGRKFTKHAPTFKIVDWIHVDELAAIAEGAPEDYEQGTDAPPAQAVAATSPPVQAETPPPAQRQARGRQATPPAQAASTAAPAQVAAPAGRRSRF